MTHVQHIQRAISQFGTQRALAEAIGCSQQQIAYMLRAQSVSAEMAVKVERATGGAVKRGDLRPDLFGTSGSPTSDAPLSEAS